MYSSGLIYEIYKRKRSELTAQGRAHPFAQPCWIKGIRHSSGKVPQPEKMKSCYTVSNVQISYNKIKLGILPPTAVQTDPLILLCR